MTLASATLTESVKALARELGFDLVAVGPAGPPEHGPAFRRWLEAGHADTMGYLERRMDDRLDPSRALPGARSAAGRSIVSASWYRPRAMSARADSATTLGSWLSSAAVSEATSS